MSEKVKKTRRNPLLKKELLAAGITVLAGMGQKSEAKEMESPEPKIEIYNAPAENMETEASADFMVAAAEQYGNYDEEQYVYDRKLSRGASVKYEGAYVNWDTGKVIFKAVSRYDENYVSTVRSCMEMRRFQTGPYDRSGDREIRREQIRDGEYNKRAATRDIIRGIGRIILDRPGR